MPTPKCRCAACKQLVSEWIGDKCTRCYHGEIHDAHEVFWKEHYGVRIERLTKDHFAEMSRFREVDAENNRFWASLVASYRNRLEVRMVDGAKYYTWYVVSQVAHLFWSLLGFVRLLSIGGLSGFRNLLPWPKK